MKCRWQDDRCQHGYWLDESEVAFNPSEDAVGSKFQCPKGQTTRQGAEDGQEK